MKRPKPIRYRQASDPSEFTIVDPSIAQTAIRGLAEELLRQVAEIDALVARLADALLALKLAESAMSQACGGIPPNGPLAAFANRLPVTVTTALSGRGFHFQGDPFAPRDASGRPDLAALQLAPHYPPPDYFEQLVANKA
jgi:hypothetical protein